jgi:RNA polymerase sigma-70 factor (ECF subfamily)
MIVRHRAIDRMRSAQRRPQDNSADNVETLQMAADDPAPDRCGPDIAKALAGLSDNQRNAVVLAFYEGLTHDELAIRLGAPLGTVKSWVRRGLLALKESMSP